jgi:large subunit ribosomal protein L13
MKTIFVNSETVKRDWYVIDATDKVLGRVATECARRLRGKHKPEYTPNCDTGDYIVVINVDKIRATGNKLQDKVYYRHTGHPGGIKSTTLGKMLQEHPTRVLEKAVKGMLPTGPLGFAQYRKLKVYAGAEHPHTAQQPKPLNF